MHVFRRYDAWDGDDNTEYPAKHNSSKCKWQRRYFSDFGPLNCEPSAKPGTAPGIIRFEGRPKRLQSLTPAPIALRKSRTPNRGGGISRPNMNFASSTLPLRSPQSQQNGVRASTSQGLRDTSPYGRPVFDRSSPMEYNGTMRYKGSSVKYLKYDNDKWNRPGYWPNCLQRNERWENYRLHQWEDNRFEACSPYTKNKAMNKINKSNRSPFQSTPYVEQSPTMLFYQQKLDLSRSCSMPSLHSNIDKEDRPFHFGQRPLRTSQSADLHPAGPGIPQQEQQTGNQEEDEGQEYVDAGQAEEAQPVAVATA